MVEHSIHKVVISSMVLMLKLLLTFLFVLMSFFLRVFVMKRVRMLCFECLWAGKNVIRTCSKRIEKIKFNHLIKYFRNWMTKTTFELRTCTHKTMLNYRLFQKLKLIKKSKFINLINVLTRIELGRLEMYESSSFYF